LFFVQILGVGWKAYWGKSWFKWNRFDFLLLSLTYIDLIMDFLTEYDDDVLVSGVMSTSIIRVFRFFKLIRFGRALRLFKVSKNE
jgi:Ion transport protein